MLVGLAGVPDSVARAQVAREGLALLDYVPDQGWVARLRRCSEADEAAQQAWADANLLLFESLADTGKGLAALPATSACGDLPVYVHMAGDTDARDGLRRLAAAGFRLSIVEGGGRSYLAGRIPEAGLEAFRAAALLDPDVVWVERGAGARLLNNSSIRILQSGSYTGAVAVWGQGVYGTNQVVAVLDTGLDVDSCFFRPTDGTRPPTNRVSGTNVNLGLRKAIAADFLYAGDDPANATAWDNHGHGTRVAGHAVGSALADPLGSGSQNGMAPAARLIVQDGGFTGADDCADLVGLGCPVTNFLPALQQAYAQGARIHNNSWGDNENGVFTNRNAYTQASRDLDAMAWSNRDFLVVCAAGNDGGPSNNVASPSTAKNGLSVAATEPGSSQENVASFSSRGWSDDGRIKPDLAAPGLNVTSSSSDSSLVTSNCASSTGSGTSYASPMVAGLAALVRDYFARGYYPDGVASSSNAFPWVSAALVKAVLINAATPMLNAASPPPARDQGWGRVNLSQTLRFTNSPHRLWVRDAPVAFGGTPALPFVRHFVVQDTATPLRVTLAWTDYPAAPGAAKKLVNDLDLLVRTPMAAYRGNVLTGGWSSAAGAFDRSNNVEQVILRTPATGLLEVSVWAHVIPQATQDFALVVAGPIEELPPDGDADGDSLPDWWERWHHGDLAAVSATNDVDGDGLTEIAEYGANSDPGDAASRLELRAVDVPGDGSVGFDVTVYPGRLYRLHYADVVAPTGWLTRPADSGFYIAGVPETTGVFRFADDHSTTNGGGDSATGSRFYRVTAEGGP